MADIKLPVHGERDWGNKLNTAINAVNKEVEELAAGGGGEGGATLVEDPNDPGLYFVPESFTEDPANPGLYLIGA